MFTVRKIITILLVFSFLSANIGRLAFIIHYELNKREITMKYCVNKDKPWMHCDGKCYLRKELKEEGRKNAPFTIIQRLEMQLICQEKAVFNIKSYITGDILFPKYKLIFTQEALSPVFHPPAIA